jgi:hypothetical protein
VLAAAQAKVYCVPRVAFTPAPLSAGGRDTVWVWRRVMCRPEGVVQGWYADEMTAAMAVLSTA